jgi:thiamine-monophosphate kinase
LIGGDTTRGPLAIGITVLGSVPPDLALRRSGAQLGDDIYISGSTSDCIGQARAGLALRQGSLQLPAADATHALQRLEAPTPRLALGLALRGLASSCMDVSDGLLGDLRHILRASGVGALLQASALLEMAAQCAVLPALDAAQRLDFLCHGGDDYELLFTAPAAQADAVAQAACQAGCSVQRIGRIVSAAAGLQVQDAAGQALPLAATGFTHF